MKRWTTHQPRSNQTLDADQFNAEQVAHRGSIASLDRTQLPALSSTDQLVTNALHSFWLVRAGEQVDLVGTAVGPPQWRAMTSRNYSGQSVNCNGASAITLDGHKGGMTYIEWSGTAFTSGLATMTHDASTPDLMEKQLRLRVIVNGMVVAESSGTLQGTESFRIFGNVVLPPGDHQVQLQAIGRPEGVEGPLSTHVNSYTIMMYHVVNSLFFAFARYR